MSQSEKLAALRLIRSENLGARTFFSLIKTFGSPVRALAKVEELSADGRLTRDIKLCSEEVALEEIHKATAFGAEIICYTDANYPALLKEISSCPPVITIAGTGKTLLANFKISLVGSRSPSINGGNFAHKIASELAEAGYTVVSGFARGIDTYAHMGSLERGTIAVTACGIDQIYPPENKKLYQDILERGLILTEQPFGSLPKAVYFPQRNRIISGLSLATAVIEAGTKSGSLITANFALEQNREVFAVPGFPLDYRYSGTNHLIKQGASLLEKTEDILNILNQPALIKQTPQQELELLHEETILDDSLEQKDVGEIRKLILNKVGVTPVTLDQIASSLNLPISVLSVVLVEMELEGKLGRVGANQVVLIA